MTKIAVIGIVGQSVFLSVNDFGVTGQTTVANRKHVELGGKGFNQAVAAAKMGADVCFLGACHSGDVKEYKAVAKSYGVKAYLCPKTQDSPYAVITTDRQGDNRVCVYHGAALSPADVYAFAPQLRRADVLLLNNEVPVDVLTAACELARQGQTKIILNPAPQRDCPREVLDAVDLFTPNQHETAGLDEYKNVVVTLGDKGCLLKQTGEIVPPYPAPSVVDTTGAGDTFNGVLAVLYAQGIPIPTAAQTACKAAGLKIQKPYVLDAIPTRKQIYGE